MYATFMVLPKPVSQSAMTGSEQTSLMWLAA
jgi:hypothetical protein